MSHRRMKYLDVSISYIFVESEDIGNTRKRDTEREKECTRNACRYNVRIANVNVIVRDPHVCRSSTRTQDGIFFGAIIVGSTVHLEEELGPLLKEQ